MSFGFGSMSALGVGFTCMKDRFALATAAVIDLDRLCAPPRLTLDFRGEEEEEDRGGKGGAPGMAGSGEDGGMSILLLSRFDCTVA